MLCESDAQIQCCPIKLALYFRDIRAKFSDSGSACARFYLDVLEREVTLIITKYLSFLITAISETLSLDLFNSFFPLSRENTIRRNFSSAERMRGIISTMNDKRINTTYLIIERIIPQGGTYKADLRPR